MRPTLRTLSLGDLATRLEHGGLIFIRANPADTSFRLKRGQRVPLEATVSSGDRENVGLYRQDCPARDRGYEYPCFQFSIYMKQGHLAAELTDHVAAIGGRFNLLSGGVAGVTMFEPEIAKAARMAAKWPGVAVAERTLIGCHPDAPGCRHPSYLAVPVAVDFGDAVPGDGILQVQPGDRIVITYHQPSGGTLAAVVEVP